MTRRLFAIVVLLFTFAHSPALQPGGLPIAEVKVKPNESVFKNSAWDRPIVLKSEEDAAKHFGKDELATLTKQVDFKKYFVVVFAWQGSGGDKLSYTVAESFPEQITFSRKPGLTRDLRQHAHVFALRANVKWSVAGKAKAGDGGVRPIE